MYLFLWPNISLLETGVTLHKNSMILAGDLDFSGIDWNKFETSIDVSVPSERFLDITDEYDLKQIVIEPSG